MSLGADYQPPATRPVLAGLRAKDAAARLAAVGRVGRKPTPAVLKALNDIAVKPAEDPMIRAAAIVALAKSGSEVVLEETLPPAVRSAAAKAAAIRSTLEMITSFDRGDPRAKPQEAKTMPLSGPGQAIESSEPEAGERSRVRSASTLPRARSAAVQMLRCGDNEMAVVTDPKLLEASRLLSAPAHPGQIAVHHRYDELDVWTVPYDILTVPGPGDSVSVTVIDDRGNSRFSGTATAGAEGLDFEVRAVRRPGAVPVLVRGHTAGGRIVIDHAAAGTRAVRPSRPSAPRHARSSPK